MAPVSSNGLSVSMTTVSSEEMIHPCICSNKYWAEIAGLCLKANQNRNVDSTDTTMFNPFLPSMAQQDVFNPRTTMVSIFREWGSPGHHMTNSCLLFTKCAITVWIFSAQNIMRYLCQCFYSLILVAWDFPVSIYRFSHSVFLWCCLIKAPDPPPPPAAALCFGSFHERCPWCWNSCLAEETQTSYRPWQHRWNMATFHSVVPISPAGESAWKAPGPWHFWSENSRLLML